MEVYGENIYYYDTYLQMEYTGTHSLHRFVPVLLGDATTAQHVPDWLHACPSFRWPADYEKVLTYLIYLQYRSQCWEAKRQTKNSYIQL